MRTIIVIVGFGLLLGGCGGTAPSAEGRLRVVAAENVYGDIAAQIGGDRISVTSLLNDPTADPHLFEPVARQGLAVSRAALVIRNGAGYDDFLRRLLDAVGGRRVVVTAADVLGAHGDANPHFWYDAPRLGRLADAIAAGLTEADPAHAAAYRAGAARFRASLRPLRVELARVRARLGGTAVASTEPVAAYLLAAAGLRDIAPGGFVRAIEDGSEPTPDAAAAMDALVSHRRVAALVYNSQTVSPLTARIRAAARAHGIPVVPVTELLPRGRDFQQWQLGQVRALARALGA